MGILALFLEQLLHPEAKGKFQLFYGNTGDYLNFVNEQNQAGYLDGKFASGFFSLTEATQETKFGAYITCR